MKKLLTRMRLEPWKVQTAATSIPRCREGQFAVSVFWLLPQIFFLPCSAEMSPLAQGG